MRRYVKLLPEAVVAELPFRLFKQKTAYEIASCLVGSEMCIRDSIRGTSDLRRQS